MAQAALRTIELPPEEAPEVLAPRLRSRRRPAQPVGWARLALVTLAVSFVVSILVIFVNTYARIAASEMRCQALKQEYAQLNRSCVELNLELEQLATQPRLAKIAQVQGLEIPDAARVHFVQGQQDFPHLAPPAPAPASRPSSWARRSGHQLIAGLGTAWQVLGGGTTHTAYAQE